MCKICAITLTIWLLLMAIGTPINANAQSQSLETLNQKQKDAQTIIEQIDNELKLLTNSSEDANKQLQLYTKRLNAKNEVLKSINQQINLLDKRNKKQSSVAKEHTETLEKMTKVYLEVIKQIQINKILLKNSQNLQTNTQQTQYTQQKHNLKNLIFELHSKKKEIESLQGKIGEEIKEIQRSKTQLDELKNQENQALQEIIEGRKKIQTLKNQISQNTQKLTSQKDKQLQLLQSIQQQIQEAIQNEINAGNNSKLSKEQLAGLSASFKRLKGKMTPPVANGKITDNYGLHNHPTQPGVKINNKGVNITGSGGAQVKVVSDGVVSKVFVVAGGATAILVRHGEYITVYSNLKNVSVKTGQHIRKGNVLGSLNPNGELHFEVWQETTTLNPNHWLNF